eukprot:1811659-Pleurochrysis_carterae.AAC.2
MPSSAKASRSSIKDAGAADSGLSSPANPAFFGAGKGEADVATTDWQRQCLSKPGAGSTFPKR